MRKWEVIESDDCNFTKGKIYKTNNNGIGFIGDDGWVYNILPEEFLGIIFKEVKKDLFLSKIVRWFKNVKIM